MKSELTRSYADLQEHLHTLDRKGLLHTIDQPVNKDTEMHPLVRWQYRGGIAEQDRKGFLFTNISDSKGAQYPTATVAIGVLAATPEIYAAGMNCSVEEIGPRWIEAMEHPIDPVEVTEAPCQEIVFQGEEVTGPGKGIARYPFPVSTPGYDTAPYSTAGIFVTKDPETGIQNMGVYRGNFKAPDRIAVMMARATLAGGYAHWKKYRALGKPMPVALVVGSPPVVEYTGPQKLPPALDEIRVAGALARGPINVVRAKSVDLLVPAEAQIIIEGEIDPFYLEPEGPFGESHGYMALEEYNFIMRVKTITQRRGPIITSLISQVTPSESSVIKKVAYEPIYLNHLQNVLNIKSVQRVSMHEPLTNLRRVVYVVFDDSATKTEIWRALQGTAALMPAVGKFCIAISQDIDPLSADHVLWALAYRCDPIEDVHIVPYRSRGHGPELKGVRWESTLLVDATLKSTMPPISLPKKEYMERAKSLWEDLGLPKLKPEFPWHGYSLGDWCEEWDRCAERAAQSDWILNGLRTEKQAKKLDEPQTAIPIEEVTVFKK